MSTFGMASTFVLEVTYQEYQTQNQPKDRPRWLQLIAQYSFL
jgi:hypothetical protein